MKKRMFVCAFIFTVYLFHFSIPSVVFADAQQVFDDNKELLLRQDVKYVLPDALHIFRKMEIQEVLSPNVIEVILDGPRFLKGIDSGFDNQFIALLTIDDDLRALFRDEQFYNVLKNSDEIGNLVELVEGTPTPTILEKVSGDNQRGMFDEPLPEPFVVVVQDRSDNPLHGIHVTFSVTESNGKLFVKGRPDGEKRRIISTNRAGQASVTLMLGPGLNSVKASVTGISNSHTFTATAIGVSGESSVIISEIMFASNESALPQWIELYNPSTDSVNLKDWELEVRNLQLNGITLNLKDREIEPQGTLLIVSKRGRSSNNFPEAQVYLQDIVLSEEGFYLKLSNEAGELIDKAGNLGTGKRTEGKVIWPLPKSVTNDNRKKRASMIRRYYNGVPKLGTDPCSWISAKNTKLPTGTTVYYGHPDDIGAPGIKSGGALPVQLSGFHAEWTDAGVVIKWTTESEVDNAGFYILRSETKNGEFKVVNPALIQGAGTTGEQNTYMWTDATAKPNVAYYYRIEDVSYAGVREQSATVRMRGFVSARGKFTTSWAGLKRQN